LRRASKKGVNILLKGIYTTGMGLAMLEKRMETVSNNLANVDTTGYKKDVALAKSFPNMLAFQLEDPLYRWVPWRKVTGPVNLGVQFDELYTDMSRGILKATEEPLNVAIASEDGYFVLETPQGDRYTRNGEFHLSAEGVLVSSDGNAVQGQNGQITLTDADFLLNEEGYIYDSKGALVDRLRIVSMEGAIKKQGYSLFQCDTVTDVENIRVIQGFLEGPNVNTITEMVNMIAVQRSYEANQKVMQAHDAALEKAVNEVGRL
jgi:flagellar basal-body rod protein FlgG